MGMHRLVPEGGIVCCGTYIPGGVSASLPQLSDAFTSLLGTRRKYRFLHTQYNTMKRFGEIRRPSDLKGGCNQKHSVRISSPLERDHAHV